MHVKKISEEPYSMNENIIKEAFDPLGEMAEGKIRLQLAKNSILGIIESYQGSYDFAQEILQNAADADEERMRLAGGYCEDGMKPYLPEIHFLVDLKKNELRVIDNGIGIGLNEALRIFIPHYTNKHGMMGQIGHRLRGYKGVGITFLAFNHNYIRISTKGPDGLVSYEFSGGKRWVDSPGCPPPPIAVPSTEECDIFTGLESGSAVTISFDDTTTPKSLSRLGTSLLKWELILRTRTSIAFTDLRGMERWNKKMKVWLIFIDQEGTIQKKIVPFRFLYPHEVENYDFLDLGDFFHTNPQCVDPPHKFRGKDAIYRTWSREEIFNPITGIAAPDEFPLIFSRNPALYGFAVYTAPLFDELSKSVAQEDRMKPIKAGVRIATMNTIEGRDVVLEPKFDASARDRLFMLIELDDVRPDLGRKGFNPALEEEVKSLGLKVIKYFNRYRKAFLKSPGVELGQATRLMGLHDLKQQAERRLKDSPLSCGISFGVVPINEPEVISIFNELIGLGIFVGFQQIGCFHNYIYDGLILYRLEKSNSKAVYDAKTNILGLPAMAFKNSSIVFPALFMEYKVSLDGLVRDLSNTDNTKMFEDLHLAVVWDKGNLYQNEYHLEDLVEKPHPTGREIYGATHVMQRKGVINGHHIQVIELRTIANLIREGKVKIKRSDGARRKISKS